MFQGVNYASAGAGIILSSGSELVILQNLSFLRVFLVQFFNPGGNLWLQGQRVSFAMQVEQFVDTFQQMILRIGEEASDRLVSNSVFYISIGVNDYIHFYIRNISNVQNLYTPWHFNQFLASNMRQELKVRLHFRFYMVYSCWRLYRDKFIGFNTYSIFKTQKTESSLN